MKSLHILCVFAVLFASLRETSSSAQSVTDPGFEVPAQGQRFTYAPTGSAWTFSAGAGLCGNRVAFTNVNPPAPQGAQIAFIQGKSAISQSVADWPSGNYQVTFYAAQRGGSQAAWADFDVRLDDVVIATITPAGSGYVNYTCPAFTVAAGAHTIKFTGLNTAGGDNTALIDAVAIVKAGSIAPRATATATVASSGKMISFAFQAIATGAATNPGQVMVAPTISVNGRSLGRLGVSWVTGYHPVALMATPGNYQIRPGSIVRITAPDMWAGTAAGGVQGLDNALAENRAGKPMLATETLPRTLRIGINHNQSPTSTNLGYYWPFQNIKYRVGWWPGNRGKFQAASWTLPIMDLGGSNGIDGTSYPGPAGLWLVMWDGTTPDAPVQFGIASGTPDRCTVTERLDLARAPPDGIGRCRVFDVQPIASAASADFKVSLTYVDPAYTNQAHYDNLWVVQPGDWDIVNGAVVLDRSDPLALSRIYLDRVGPNVGSMRWVDSTLCGGNPRSIPYPEYLPSASDENWGDLSFVRELRGYVAAGPVDVTATPYIYSPFFRQPGQSYTCTLGAAVTSTPASGTRETWTITDGAEAPLLAGLEITADSEVCRIVAGSGTAWTVLRGSNGTTPATHQPGMLAISGRRPIRDVLDANGTRSKALTVQLTFREPHGRTTCNGMSCGGSGWPTIIFTNGSKWNLQGTGHQPYVTGPNTVAVLGSCNGAGGVPDRVYPLNPDVQQWEYRAYGGVPIEAAAIATGKFARADFHVNVPLDAVDDLVYEIARRVLANFPAGRRVYVEYSNEPWNWAFTGPFYHNLMGSITVPGNPYPNCHYAWRAGQVQQIFRSVFGAAGRGAEIRGLVNCQMGSGSTQVTPHLEYGLKAGTPFDDVAVAPYWSLEDTPLNRQVAAALDDEQFLDVVGADQRTSTHANNAWMADTSKAIASYNQAHAANAASGTSRRAGDPGAPVVKLYGYEGGIEFACQWDNRRNHDLIYNPNWYFTELDWIAWCQIQGFERINIYNLAMWWGPQAWAGYHTSQQRHSRGDGLNGAADNRAVKARSKPAGVNQDLHVDAVRPQAWQDWLGTLQP